MTTALRLSNAFDPERIALIREMEADGWTGRLSTRGHAIMRAPDGVATASISPKATNGNSGANVGQEYRTWKRAQLAAQEPVVLEAVLAEAIEVAEYWGFTPKPQQPEPVDTTPEPEAAPEPEPAPEPERVRVPQLCPECQRPFATLQALSVHHVRAHVRVDCPICDQTMSPSNLPRHQATHAREFASPDLALRAVHQLRRQLAEARTEALDWQTLAEEADARVSSMAERQRAALAALQES